jgi:uncharacterized membrane protein
MRRLLQLLMILVIIILPPLAYAQDYNPIELSFQVYSNGLTEVNYLVESDPTNLRIEVPIFGDHLYGLVIMDQDGLPLDSTQIDMGIIVDSIGSTYVNISYFTSSLTAKMGLVWTFNVSTPLESLIVLPYGATIFDISHIPRDLFTVNGNQHLVLSDGDISISYILSINPAREDANTVINNAEDVITKAKLNQLNVTTAESLLTQSLDQYENENYDSAKELAEQARKEAEAIVELAESTSLMINSAKQAVESARAEGRINGLDDAEVELEKAESSYYQGNYDDSHSYATAAYQIALSAKKTGGINQVLIFSFFIIIGISLIFFMRKRISTDLGITKVDEISTKVKETRTIVDLERLFEAFPDLRFDDRETIRFLAEQEGEAFANEIRERFDMPRSSAWRMIRRLINEGVVEEKKIGNQSLIRIQKRFLKKE